MRKKLTIILIAVSMAVSVFTLIFIGIKESPYAGSSDQYEKITILGEYELNGNIYPISDGFSNLSGCNDIIITGHLSQDIPENQTLFLRIDNLRVVFYVNGEKLYSFGEEGTMPSFAKSAGNVWDWYISPGITANDDIRIELHNVYTNHEGIAFSSFVDNLYSGSGGSFVLNLLRSGLVNTIYSTFIISMGVLLLIVSLTMRSSKKLFLTTLTLGAFAVFSGIWFIIYFNVQSLYLPMGVFSNALDIICLSFTEAFILLYLSMYSKTKLRLVLVGLSFCDMLLVIYAAFAQISGTADYYDNVGLLYSLLIAGTIAILVTVAYESVKIKNQEMKELIPSLVILCAGAIGDIICFAGGLLGYILLFKFGYLVFMLLQLLRFAKAVRHVLEDNARVELLRGIAYKDSLTGVRNRNAYLENAAHINNGLSSGLVFGVAVFDLNGLKSINDHYGHKQGDETILRACRMICNAFGNSPVFRIGGDEFVALLNEKDCTSPKRLYNRLKEEERVFAEANPNLQPIHIACGIAVYNPKNDASFEDTASRADMLMYKDKNEYRHSKGGRTRG